jgi:hypothetical protein
MSLCKGCGREILYAKSYQTGSTIPLEECKHVYRELEPDLLGLEGGLMVEQIKDERLWISHFLVCPKADEFKKDKNPSEMPK